MAAKADRYPASDLEDRHKAALRLADAVLTQPREIDDDLVRELRRWFCEDQLVELTVDILKWSFQKVVVALGIDDEVRPGELTDLVFDAQGGWVPSVHSSSPP